MSKIWGGEASKPNTWGWTVSLRVLDVHFCGGSILNEWFIITAAHCLVKKMDMLSSITVCAGTNRLSYTCPQRRSVQNVINHHAYNNETVENDIALILVDIPFEFTETSIARICLPDATHHNEYPQVGTNVIAVGWGKTKTGNISDILQQVTLQVSDKLADACYSLVKNHQLQLCAAISGKGKIFLFNYYLSFLFLLLSCSYL
jgi:secreted trypsin-like serine protease